MEKQAAGVPAGDVSTELRAALAARQELGPDMEDHVVESFLTRIEGRVTELTAEAHKGKGDKPAVNLQSPAAVVVPTLGVAVPLVVLAGVFAQSTGVIAVMVGVVLINLLFYIDRWVMKP